MDTSTSAEDELLGEEEEIQVGEFEFPGVETVEVGEETQHFVHCSIGPDVNCQRPWKDVDKSLILAHIEELGESSEFYEFEEALRLNQQFVIYMGFIVDNETDEDLFYICLTKEAREYCQEKNLEKLRIQEESLNKATVKEAKEWEGFGSEEQMTEGAIEYTRSLYVIDVEAKYPQSDQPDTFTVRDASACRDCYEELTTIREKFSNVIRKRVDCGIQNVPVLTNNIAQTELKYPKNFWTQTLSEDNKIEDIPEKDSDNESEDFGPIHARNRFNDPAVKLLVKQLKRPSFIKTMNNFVSLKNDPLIQMLEFNSTVDLYVNEYPALAANDDFDTTFNLDFKEYICFTDVRARKKFVSCSVFHPMWAGIVAIAYSDTSATIYKNVETTDDPVQKAVYGVDPVFIWSHVDSLYPKLVLQTPREVKFLKFCPYNENILIGGCVNGQIIIWDLTDRLEKAETEEFYSETRQKYKITMNQHMLWMKNIHQKSVVPYTAVSSLMYSHNAAVTDIRFLSPNFDFLPTGFIRLLKDDQPRSEFLFTASEDGTILIWSLSLENADTITSKKVKRSKRILKRPSGLMTSFSPYSILDRNIKPVYKLFLGTSGQAETSAVQTLNVPFPKIAYKQVMKNLTSGRIYFDFEIIPEKEEDISQSLTLGTMYGEVIKMEWEGRVANSGEQVNSEFCKTIFKSNLHDGVVTEVLQNRFNTKIYLSIGGKIFAIWSEALDKRPLIWKKHNCLLTDARWSRYKSSVVFITTSDGTLETYDFNIRSDKPIVVQTLSGGQITNISVHHRPLKNNLIGIGDMNGAFTLFFAPSMFIKSDSNHITNMNHFLNNELEIKRTFLEWQKKWTDDHPEIMAIIKQREQDFLDEKEAQAKAEKERLERIKEEEAERIRIEKAKVLTPEEKWRRIIDRLIEKTIAMKKRINRALLIEQERPLRDLEAQRLEKERQLLEIMKKQQTIFDDTVSILFPEAVKVNREEIMTVIPTADYTDQKLQYMQDYKDLVEKYKDAIPQKPFRFELDWESIYSEAKDRRQSLNTYGKLLQGRKQTLERGQYSTKKGPTSNKSQSFVKVKGTSEDRIVGAGDI